MKEANIEFVLVGYIMIGFVFDYIMILGVAMDVIHLFVGICGLPTSNHFSYLNVILYKIKEVAE